MENIIFLKYGDCINEYNYIFNKKRREFYDGQEPYLKQIVDYFREKQNYNVSILSLGTRNKSLNPKQNLELRVVDQFSTNRILRLLKILKTHIILFFWLLKRSPKKILYLGDLNYILVLFMHSLLLRTKIFLFLAGSVEIHPLLTRLLAVTGKYCYEIISITQRNIEILRRMGLSKKCHLFYPRLRKISKSMINSTELRKDKNFKVLFVGRLSYVKGLDILKKVVLAAKDKNISFYIIGNGPYYRELMLFKYIYNLENLYFLGFMQNEKIYSFIHDSDVGIMPSKSEGFPQVALEFMIMETPVIASRVGGIPEIIRDGNSGIMVDANDADGFLRKIELLRNNRNLYLDLLRGTKEMKERILNFNRNFSYYLKKILEDDLR